MLHDDDKTYIYIYLESDTTNKVNYLQAIVYNHIIGGTYYGCDLLYSCYL